MPAVDINGSIVFESLPICEYLDEIYPEPRLLPQDPYKKAQVRAFCEIINSGMQPLLSPRFLGRIKNLGGDPDEWGRGYAVRGFECKKLDFFFYFI